MGMKNNPSMKKKNPSVKALTIMKNKMKNKTMKKNI